MPSIFVWMTERPPMTDKTDKADKPQKNSVLQYYSGSNWFLEEHQEQNASSSYMYTDQVMISHDSRNILVYHAVKMPYNWIGSDLLEVCEVPYRLIKEDSYAKLEQLGQWTRCIVYHTTVTTTLTTTTVTEDYTKILQWITPQVKQKVPYHALVESNKNKIPLTKSK